jgi:cysteine desulfurase
VQRIYLDANATTPVLPEAVDAMRPFWAESFGNPSSAHHSGQGARSAVERARGSVARLLHCSPKEVVFTSGGTESDNLALAGVLQPYLDRASNPLTNAAPRPPVQGVQLPSQQSAHLVTSQIEHHAVLYTAQNLEQRGIEVTYFAPRQLQTAGSGPQTEDAGLIDPAAFESTLRPHTRLVSIMLANNETGAVQPVGKLARIAKAYAERNHTTILVHTDAVQAAAKLPIDLAGEFKNVDLLSISGHKMYAPQGTGVLFVRSGITLAPLLYGGPHERQRRAGTENVAGIVGLGCAADAASHWLSSGAPQQLRDLTAHLEAGLLSAIPEAHVNVPAAHRAPNTINMRFDGVDAEALLIALDMKGIAASFGAACQSGATEPSHVLLAMGLTPAEARSSLRLSLSRFTTADEIARALEIIPATVQRLRAIG